MELAQGTWACQFKIRKNTIFLQAGHGQVRLTGHDRKDPSPSKGPGDYLPSDIPICFYTKRKLKQAASKGIFNEF